MKTLCIVKPYKIMATALVAVSVGCTDRVLLPVGHVLEEKDTPIEYAQYNYAELASYITSYNANLEAYQVTATMGLAWTEEDGSEHGTPYTDARIAIRRPYGTLCKIDHPTQGMQVLMGSNATHYWLFDNTEDKKILWFGARGGIGELYAADLWMGIAPTDLPVLMGFVEMDPLDEHGSVSVYRRFTDDARETYVEYLLVENNDYRVLLDLATMDIARIDIVGTDGYSQFTALFESSPHILENGFVPSECQFYPLSFNANIDVKFDRPRTNGVRDQLFDLNGLTARYKPDEIIDLDEWVTQR